jgi:hypothetical protein
MWTVTTLCACTARSASLRLRICWRGGRPRSTRRAIASRPGLGQHCGLLLPLLVKLELEAVQARQVLNASSRKPACATSASATSRSTRIQAPRGRDRARTEGAGEIRDIQERTPRKIGKVTARGSSQQQPESCRPRCRRFPHQASEAGFVRLNKGITPMLNPDQINTIHRLHGLSKLVRSRRPIDGGIHARPRARATELLTVITSVSLPGATEFRLGIGRDNHWQIEQASPRPHSALLHPRNWRTCDPEVVRNGDDDGRSR